MVKIAVALCFVLVVAALNVVHGESNKDELLRKFEKNVGVYVEQCGKFVDSIRKKLNTRLALDKKRVGGNSVSSKRSIIGTMVECSKSFALSISEPTYDLMGAGVFFYAHVRAYMDGIVDCFRTNGFLAPVALPVCFAKYSGHAITSTVRAEYKMLRKALGSFMDTVTLTWLEDC